MSYEEEKKEVNNVQVVAAVDHDALEQHAPTNEEDAKIDIHTGVYDGVHRKMKQRHIQMIALAGTLGTGLFLGSGKAIVHAGPAGALLAYITVGTITWCMIQSLGEIMCFAPISGGYVHFATRFIHPSVGFALGWMNWYSGVVGLPTEIISASLIISYWDPVYANSKAHQAAYITAILLLTFVVNFFGVQWFGESEFVFACIKIMLIVGLIIGGLVVDLGGGPNHDRIGFRYWKNPGAFVSYLEPGGTGKFLGWFTTLLQAGYSFSGMEGLAFTAAECENPRASLTKAVRRIFARICAFYVLGILIVGMLVPSTNPDLLSSTGTAASSPFTIAFNIAGIKVLPSVINAGVLSSAFSAANSGIYGSSRTLYGMALRGQAPRMFSKTWKNGLPWVSLTSTCIFSFLSYMALSDGANTVLNWLSNLTTISGFIGWGTIAWTYLRFKAAMDAQGVERDRRWVYNRFQPYLAWWSLVWSAIIVIFSGYTVFLKGNWSVSDFVIDYLNIPLYLGLIFCHWIYTGRPGFTKLEDIDLVSNIPGEEINIERNPATTAVGKFFQWLF